MKKKNVFITLSSIIIIWALALNLLTPGILDVIENGSLFPGTRERFSKNVEKNIGGNAGLGLGYLVGEKDALPDGLEDKMKAIGLAHFIVISGTHLSIIISFVRKIFEKVSRFLALYFSIGLLLLYLSFVGITPSLIRASVATVLSLIAWYFGRRKTNFRTVIYVLVISLAIDPYLLGNLSFQFSMLAYSGILLILPRMIRFFYGRDRPGLIGSTILSSLAATIACLPIQIYFFGSFSIVSLFANLLILPTISFAMVMTFFAGLFGDGVLKIISTLTGKIASLVLEYHIEVINRISDLDGVIFETEKYNGLWLILYVTIVFGLLIFEEMSREGHVNKMCEFEKLKTRNIWV